MVSTLITGMSAVGKSSVVGELSKRGYRAIDLADEWSQLVPDDSAYADPTSPTPMDWRWCEEKVYVLLTANADTLFVAGTSTYQARFYPPLDHIVLLSIPVTVVRGSARQQDY